MPNVTMGLRGKEDLSRHDPASGTGVQTFTRPNSNPSLADVVVTKVSAADIPLLDAAVVAGGATPFEALVDTQAAKNAETALALIRKNAPFYKNFETYGGVPGTGLSDGIALKNTEVFNKILTDLASEAPARYNGIYFPGAAYSFKDFAGTAILTMDTMPVTLLGAGSQTQLIAQASSTAAFPLLKVIDGNGVRLVDIKFDATAATRNACDFIVSATPVQDVKILNCFFSNGNYNLRFIGGGTTAEKDAWIAGCRFSQSTTYNLAVENVSGTHVLDNTFEGTGLGLIHQASGGANAMRDVLIQGNVFAGANQGIFVNRTGTYSAANHKGIRVILNQITAADITIVGMNHVLCQTNTMYAGGITVSFSDGMVTAQRCQVFGNHVIGRIGPGIVVAGVNVTVEGFEIVGGSVRDCTQEGIRITCAGAPAKWGRITEVLVHNCSRQDSSATDYTAILLEAPNAGGGVQETIVSNNIIRSTSVTGVNSNMHKYGVEEQAGGVSNKNMIGPNFIQGYTTADVITSGVASLDVVAALTAAAATYSRFDGGPAV